MLIRYVVRISEGGKLINVSGPYDLRGAQSRADEMRSKGYDTEIVEVRYKHPFSQIIPHLPSGSPAQRGFTFPKPKSVRPAQDFVGPGLAKAKAGMAAFLPSTTPRMLYRKRVKHEQVSK